LESNIVFRDSDPIADDGSTAAFPNSARDEAAAERLNEAFKPIDPVQRVRLLRQRIDGSLVFTTSFGLEDQALTHLIAAAGVDVRFVTLDTGRLFPETYTVWAETEQRYNIRIDVFHPAAEELEALVARQGINGFYSSPAARKACCAVRKLVPLGRALAGSAGWITGLRADQSDLRRDMRFVSYETDHGLLKANPLFDWSRDQVAALVEAENIPNNPLHKRGFLSIGCAPCTRAVAPGEPERAGRWWWESEGTNECGLHLTADGRLIPAKRNHQRKPDSSATSSCTDRPEVARR
jgi:phosphoadenosine phosphosulfate reductase